MNSLIEVYNGILQEIQGINGKIEVAERRISDIQSTREADIPVRIKNLEEQIEKIDEYMLKIEAFRKLAERNLSSQNVLVIEAPPGYRVNLNRLRQWAMMIDPMSKDDPYAQRVYAVARCDEFFLDRKRKEFTDRIAELKQDLDSGESQELLQLRNQIRQYEEDLGKLALGSNIAAFAEAVKRENSGFWFEEAPKEFVNCKTAASSLAPGAYAVPLTVPKEQRTHLKNLFGKFYDSDGSRVLLPVELETDKEFALSVICAPARSRELDMAIRNLILNIIQRNPAGSQKVYVLDGVRFNSASLGELKQLEDSFAIARIPRNPEQLSAALEQIVSSFADTDDILELADSVVDYNKTIEDETKRIPRITLIIYGWPNSFEGRDREYLQRIMTNYERYGISFICVSYRANEKETEKDSVLPEYAALNAIKIRMRPKETTIQIGEQPIQRFVWYIFRSTLSTEYVESIFRVKVEKKAASSVYPDRYDLVSMPTYERSYKKIELPYGIDSKGKEHSASFENENFAAYLVGASRSGKSTLLHTLIAGIIRNYHPDNLELWLADFKQLEFKKYIEHCPPHVRYILLDESTELVYDLIDKLTDKMLERQRIFARLGKERIDQIDPLSLDEPMPVIFVILDEFSIMSQAIAESQTYRLRLQNLLAKGAALGIKFLFSSQTFTTGIAGLTPTARAQIQQRIAMKGSREEISETLELSANLKTEQVRNWMDALPPHYALVKYRMSADTLPQIVRTLVMYIPDYTLRDRLIETIRNHMEPDEKYQPGKLSAYVDKHPVLVDGNTYEAFSKELLLESIGGVQKRGQALGDESYMILGTPRLMSRTKLIALTPETRENMLLIGRAAEQMCMASVVTSAIKSYLLQKKHVQIWAYGKNALYKMCRDLALAENVFAQITYSEGIDNVCDAIRRMKANIERKVVGDELIVLLGLDRICADFDFVEGGGSRTANNSLEEQAEQRRREREQELLSRGALAVTQKDLMRNLFAARWDADAARKEGLAAGVAESEIDLYVKQKRAALAAAIQTEVQETKSLPTEKKQVEVQKEHLASGAYSAGVDLQYIVKQGSRMGYHFFLALNNYDDLKTTTLKVDWFRHRMAFQMSAEDSREIFTSKVASGLPEHVCQYYDTMNLHSFRPYLHRGISWDGWTVDENGNAVNPFAPVSN